MIAKVVVSAALYAAALSATVFCGSMAAEVCKTQSQMQPAERDSLAQAALTFAQRVQANDSNGIQALTIAEYTQNFGGIAAAIATAMPKTQGARLEVESIFLLDASDLKPATATAAEAQFFCSLNQTPSETNFIIPGLPSGLYGFAMVNTAGTATPWQLAFLLRQEQGTWKLAGFYPRALTAGGHDGLWYWTTARTMTKDKHPWSAWLYYQEAENLLRPAGFLSSTHFEKLQAEQLSAAPPALSGGISTDAPLVVKGKGDAEYRFTVLVPDDSFNRDKLDIVAHMKVDALGDAGAERVRSTAAMSALLAAYPELRQSFHGVWIFTEAPGQSPATLELAMPDIPS